MKKSSNIFEHTDCVSEETILKYISDKLSPAEKHDVEKHLIDCQMCSDAAEGLAMISDKSEIPGIISELNQKIEKRTEKKESKVVFLKQYGSLLAVAASVILVIGLFWFFRNNMKEMDATSSEKIFADKFVPPSSELSKKESEENPEDKQNIKSTNSIPVTAQKPDAATHFVKPTVVNSGKNIISEKNLGSTEKISTAKEEVPSQLIIPDEEKTEKDNRKKNSEITTKENLNNTATSNADIREEGAKLLSEDVSKNKNELISQKDKEEAKEPESVPTNTTTGSTAGAYDPPAAYKSLSFSKQESKNAADNKAREQSQEGNVFVLKSEKKSKKEKPLVPEKASGGYYETQATTAASSGPQAITQPAKGKITDSVAVSSELAIMDVTTETSLSNDAMSKYDKQDYAGAVLDFEQTLKQNPGDEKSLFYSAVSYLSLGQPDKAITNLNKVLQNKNSNYFDDAQWYLSLSYIKKKDAQNARKNLMEILKNPESKYQKQAGETLKEINK